MGTRGAIGFRQNGKDKVTYNHFGSYPDGLGINVLEFARSRSEELSTLKHQVFQLIMVTQDDIPTSEQIEICKQSNVINLDVSEQSEQDFYCLLREAQGNLGAYLELGFMIDSKEFLKDFLFCEWAYIINLDDETLEVYTGFNHNKDADGRYAHFYEERQKEYQDESEYYYGVVLMKTYKLSELPNNDEFLKDLELEEDED